MKKLNVVAAIIKNKNKFLATQRGYGEFKDLWEFPGGKIENNESKKDALIREINEELNIIINVEKFVLRVEYHYPSFFLQMFCFLCNIKKGNIELLEHNDAKWLSKQELYSVNWIPADIEIVDFLKENL